MSDTTEYKNIDLEISVKGDGYSMKVRSHHQGTDNAPFLSPLDDDEVTEFLNKVKKARLRARERKKKPTRQEKLKRKDFEEFGKKLFDQVFIEEARDLLMRSLPSNRNEKVRLRINFQDKAAKLAALPWEYLWNPRKKDFFCVFKSTSLVRYLEIPEPTEPLRVQGKLRVLVAIANPHNDLNVDAEVNDIKGALEPLGDSIFFKTLREVNWSDLKKELDTGAYHIFHFIGHGNFDAEKEEGSLWLEDGPVNQIDLRRFISNIPRAC